jgi:hypothetical protein
VRQENRTPTKKLKHHCKKPSTMNLSILRHYLMKFEDAANLFYKAASQANRTLDRAEELKERLALMRIETANEEDKQRLIDLLSDYQMYLDDSSYHLPSNRNISIGYSGQYGILPVTNCHLRLEPDPSSGSLIPVLHITKKPPQKKKPFFPVIPTHAAKTHEP